jgi:hypothetical protein
MTESQSSAQQKMNVDSVDVWFGFVPAFARYTAFISWANVIVRAIRGEEAKEDWKTFASTGFLIGVWTLTTGAKFREMASLRGAAVEMRGLMDEANAQFELRDRQAAERYKRASKQEARMLSLTRWLVALAVLTLAAAIVTLAVAIAQ